MNRKYWTESSENVWVAAHRGWCAKYPENTMPAFRAAMELGVDQVETDVRVTKDGALVLMHDASVTRTTDGTGLVIDKTLDELLTLDAGVKKGAEFAGTRVPLLTELLDLTLQYPAMTLDLELKEYPTPGHEAIAYEVCDRTIALVEEYGLGSRIVLNTFSGRLHEYIRAKYGDRYPQHVYYPLNNLGVCRVDPYSYAYCCCMFTDDDSAWDAMAARGVEVWAGASTKDEATVDTAIRRGSYLITANNPDEILRLLRLKGRHA